jgi:hypothetical protein
VRKVPTPSGPFGFQLYFENLGPDNLGCTIFNSLGVVEAILVSRSLEERTPPGPAHAFAQRLLTRRVTVFCADRSLLTLRILEKTNDEYCADRKTFW